MTGQQNNPGQQDQQYWQGQTSWQQAAGQGWQQPGSQQSWQQPEGQTYWQQGTEYYQPPCPTAVPMEPGQIYPMSSQDKTMRLIAFIFMCISLAVYCWMIIPLAWMIPMTIISWGIYKGTKPNTVAFGVCSLIFCSLVSGILLLCTNKDR